MAGVWVKEGWTITTVEVQVGGTIHRVFPPGSAKHEASFTVLRRAKGYAEGRLKGLGPKAAVSFMDRKEAGRDR
jgi:hypothetical protein